MHEELVKRLTRTANYLAEEEWTEAATAIRDAIQALTAPQAETCEHDDSPHMPTPICHYCNKAVTDVACIGGSCIGHCGEHRQMAVDELLKFTGCVAPVQETPQTLLAGLYSDQKKLDYGKTADMYAVFRVAEAVSNRIVDIERKLSELDRRSAVK